MPLGLDIAAVAAPAATALAGAYAGARWQGRSEANAELRALLDDGISTLQRLGETFQTARMHFGTEALNTSDTNREALVALDSERALAESIGDRIMGRTEAGAPVYKHYVGALRAGETARNVMVLAAHRSPSHELRYDLETEFEKVETGIGEFESERQRFRQAVQARIAPRKWFRHRVP